MSEPPIASLPSELVRILARFSVVAVVSLARANRAFWGRFRDDAALWCIAVDCASATSEGRRRLRKHSRAILDRRPALARQLPRLIVQQVEHFSISPNGAMIACARRDALRVIDAKSHAQLALVCLAAPLHSEAAFSPSGRSIAFALLGSIYLYECVSWSCSKVVRFGRAGLTTTLAFLSDDSLLSGVLTNIQVWNTQTGAQRYLLAGRSETRCLAVSRDRFACGRLLGHVELWTHHGERAFTKLGHVGAVADLAFDSAGALLVSASANDCTARVWRAATGDCVFHVSVGQGGVFGVALRGTLLALSTRDGVGFAEVKEGGAAAAMARAVAADRPRKVRFAGPDRVVFGQSVDDCPLCELAL